MQSAALSSDISIHDREAARDARPRRGWRTPLVWGGAGFLLGMAFWHMVGFWSFLTATVLRAPPSGLIATVVEPDAGAASARSAVVLAKRGEAVGGEVRAASGATGGEPCAALHLDRESNVTQLSDCAGAKALRTGSGIARSDRLDTPAAPVAAWSVNVAPASATRISSGD